jgi:CRISPR-associated endonuclease/helicase Cas3
VDQATNEAEKLQQRLNDKSRDDLEPVRLALRRLSAEGSGDLIGVSTLRGQFADNAEWREHPARPAVIVGTIDMIGSRLLFSGYGRGFKSRPLHAGFIGQDALLVHDEAHLEPAFQQLIEAVESEQERRREFRRFRVMALTATSRGVSENQFTLGDTDRTHGEIRRRIEAKKGISFHAVEAENTIAASVFHYAFEFKDSNQAILIFLRRVEDVQDLSSKLQKQRLQVDQLTGTMRGYERDRMAKTDSIFARFVPDMAIAPVTGTVYLVCTSAGEVGVNMSADHLVCDLTPFESMTQRFGRVNRFGKGDARIEIVHPRVGGELPTKKASQAELEFNHRRERTLALLQTLPRHPDGRYDGSPAALESLPAEERRAAFTPAPAILPTSEILFDAWALTSVRGKMPGRPPVADWLHGITEWEPPQTYVAWRQEVEVITEDLKDLYPPEDLLEDYPLKPHELLRDVTRRVSEQLTRVAERHPEVTAWLVDSEGNIRIEKLAQLVSREMDFGDCTVLLPPSAGGLTEKGMLDGSADFDETRHNYDVADEWLDEEGRPRRCRLWDGVADGMRQVRVIDTHPDGDDDEDNEEQAFTRRYWRWYARPRSADDDGSMTARREQDWHTHTAAIERIARDLVAKLGLHDLEASAVGFAAKWHDLGKRRDLWQRSIGNRGYPERVLAKSGPSSQGFRCQYRHEFGSLIDIANLAEFLCLSPDTQDLVQHLIAAHHGRARPHFPLDEVFDSECASEQQVAETACEVPRRFARLQRKYGRWGLAYLESLVRAADALASQELEPGPTEVSVAVVRGTQL